MCALFDETNYSTLTYWVALHSFLIHRQLLHPLKIIDPNTADRILSSKNPSHYSCGTKNLQSTTTNLFVAADGAGGVAHFCHRNPCHPLCLSLMLSFARATTAMCGIVGAGQAVIYRVPPIEHDQLLVGLIRYGQLSFRCREAEGDARELDSRGETAFSLLLEWQRKNTSHIYEATDILYLWWTTILEKL